MKNNDLTTEARNARSLHIDSVPTIEMVRIMNEEDMTVPAAVGRKLPEIAAAVDCIAARLKEGGRLFYIGAGTSGRLGVLDASECPPTFNVSPELIQGIIAGGDGALRRSSEASEDDESTGAALIDEYQMGENDVVVGIAASGNTPYVVGAVREANARGIATVGVCCNEDCALARNARYPIAVEVGPEVVQGSTRLKSGTAQKLVLNMLSTCTMIKLGKVYGNMMVDMRATNNKLRERAKRIVMQATGAEYAGAERCLEETDYDIKRAIVMLRDGVSAARAGELIAECGGVIKSLK